MESRQQGKTQRAEELVAKLKAEGKDVHVMVPSGKWPGGLRDWFRELVFRREKPVYPFRENNDWKDEDNWGDENDV